MRTVDELSDTAINICRELSDYTPAEVLQITQCISMSAIAALLQNRTFIDVVRNGMEKPLWR